MPDSAKNIIIEVINYSYFSPFHFSWFGAYRDAQSFRFSSYFVGFLGELTLTLSGLGATKRNGDVKW